jgi:hypothetical protein
MKVRKKKRVLIGWLNSYKGALQISEETRKCSISWENLKAEIGL